MKIALFLIQITLEALDNKKGLLDLKFSLSSNDDELNLALQIGRWTVPSSSAMDVSLNESSFDGDMTGQIGTALYVAPEMNAGKTTATYNQKVKIIKI